APAEFEAGLAHRIVPFLGTGVALGQVGRVRGNPVGDYPLLYVVAVGEPQVRLGGDVAEHGGPVPADLRSSDGTGTVVVPRRDVRGEGTERVEGGFFAPLQLLLHVFTDEMHRNVARALVHRLYVVLPGDPGQLTLGSELRELCLVVGVGDRARTQPVPEREGDVVSLHDLADLTEAGVQEA